MDLTDLDPRFIRRVSDTEVREVPRLEMADGIRFLCPKCLEDNRGERRGVHSIMCWRPGVPQTMKPGPGRWEMRGNDLLDLTLVGVSNSILLTGGCRAHFFVTHGHIVLA